MLHFKAENAKVLRQKALSIHLESHLSTDYYMMWIFLEYHINQNLVIESHYVKYLTKMKHHIMRNHVIGNQVS